MEKSNKKETPRGGFPHKKDTTPRFTMQPRDAERGLWNKEQWERFLLELEHIYLSLKAKKQEMIKFSILINGSWHVSGSLLDTGLFRGAEIIGNFEEGWYKIKDPDQLAASNGRL